MSVTTVVAILSLTKTLFDVGDKLYTVFTKDFSDDSIDALKKKLDALELVLESKDLDVKPDDLKKIKELRDEISKYLDILSEVPDSTLIMWKSKISEYIQLITEKHLIEVKKTTENVAAQHVAKLGGLK